MNKTTVLFATQSKRVTLKKIKICNVPRGSYINHNDVLYIKTENTQPRNWYSSYTLAAEQATLINLSDGAVLTLPLEELIYEINIKDSVEIITYD